MDTSNLIISFIIPTYNEEEYIGKNLSSINTLVKSVRYEIIVVDNGSTDNTIDIIREFSVKCLIDPSKTIGGLRNLGAFHAKGQFLVFLDADVMLTEQWDRNICQILHKITKSYDIIITGSRCGISAYPSWIERYWFLPMSYEKAGYINSGHLIVEKKALDKLGGFKDSLVTGEDYDFCLRAKKEGGLIENEPALKVIHEGYPKTILDFIKREIWHGTQDCMNLYDFIHSLVAVVSLLYCLIFLTGIVAAILLKSLSVFFLAVFMNSIIVLMAALRKKQSYSLNIGAYFLLYNVYFFSRGLSLVKKIKSLF